MGTDILFEPLRVGAYNLSHRVVLAPMTRIRSDELFSPTDLSALYYGQRASDGGLLISEAVHISPEGTPVWQIYQRVEDVGGQVPGIWSDVQIRGWSGVVDSVHGVGGRISCQLLHAGRVAQAVIGEHPAVRGRGYALPSVSSSERSIPASNESGNQYVWDKESTPPRALSRVDIRRICGDYQSAARNALSAGFDYVELHGAHGYLVEQFLSDGVNDRSDEYGGSVENRCRFLFEVVESLLEVVDSSRLGVRLSPTLLSSISGVSPQIYFGVEFSDPLETYECAVRGLNDYGLAYLLLTEPRVGGLSLAVRDETAYKVALNNGVYRACYDGVLMGAGGFTGESGRVALSEGCYDLVAFGRWFLANPDLARRFRDGLPLNVYERSTFYGGGAEGYTDYPTYDEIANSPYEVIRQEDIVQK